MDFCEPPQTINYPHIQGLQEALTRPFILTVEMNSMSVANPPK